ncbi:MAG TPA: hypothetical protein VEL31_09920 [Ktedonobacteraceae bacterium]|nr:hypothetical protein [Ktedonobacteraceae bacterium]
MIISMLQAEKMSNLIELGLTSISANRSMWTNCLRACSGCCSANTGRASSRHEHRRPEKTIGDLTVNFVRSRVLRAGQDIPLSPREYRLPVSFPAASTSTALFGCALHSPRSATRICIEETWW